MQGSIPPRLIYTSKIWHLRTETILRVSNANERCRNAWSHASTITRWPNLDCPPTDVAARHATYQFSTLNARNVDKFFCTDGIHNEQQSLRTSIREHRLLRSRPVIMSLVLFWSTIPVSYSGYIVGWSLGQQTGYALLRLKCALNRSQCSMPILTRR